MKRITITMLVLSVFLENVNAQINFTLADPQPDLIEVYGGSFASGDIDNDGDQDLLMTGLGPGSGTALYLNDGNGDFTEVSNTPFPTARFSVTEFVDLDADGDLDLYFSGIGAMVQEFTHIYINDGFGDFTQLNNPFLPEFQGSGAAIEDIDSDGDLDIIISAIDKNDEFVADTYLNDGNANFTPSGSTAFIPVKFASVAFIDVENDGDADVIISGVQANSEKLTRLYLNDGLGNYTEDTNTNFVQLSADDVDVADTDNDGDLDILMSGTTDAFDVRTILYLNEGDGEFTELTTVDLQQTFAGTNAIADLDNDGDQDIVIIGSQDGGLPNIFNIVYENLGNNVFEPAITLGGEYIAACVVDDFNGDELSDIVILGFVDNTNFYWNTGENLGTTDFSNGQAITMFPNPANDIVNISSDKDQLQKIELYSMTGSLIFKTDLNSNIYALNIFNYPIGTYLLKVFSQDNDVINTKIVKK
tara:strand:- start:9488 stop:10912 length:1425 start_codon:yes stop_codon:yes gene_type:complete